MISSSDLSLRLLSPAVISAVLTFFVAPVTSHAPPQQTSTSQRLELSDAVPWPLPTADPLAARHASPHYAFDQLLLPRQLNTVCGFIGGDAVLPATCSLGSHCVADVQNSVIGCCPDAGPCTTGVFTGCVDGNSGPQTADNPFVFTCTGNELCFQNQFQGGFVQFGCDATSRPVATVVPSAIGGGAAVSLPTVSVSIIGTQITATTITSESTTATQTTETSSDSSTTATRSSTVSTSRTTSKTNSETESSTTSTASTASTTSATSTVNSETATTTTTDTNSDTQSSTTTESSTTGPPASGTGDAAADDDDDDDGGQKNVGAIVGGAIGGIAGAAFIFALLFLLWRRRKGKGQKGPTDQYAQYLSNPMTSQGPSPPPPAMIEKPRFSQGPLLAQRNLNRRASTRSTEPYASAASYWLAGSSGGSGVGAVDDTDETPLTGRMPTESYSGGFRRQDSQPLPRVSEDGSKYSSYDSDYTSTYGTYPGPRRGGGSGVLWQQNRDATRNPSWV